MTNDERLGPLLDSWAATQRLDQREAERILDAIIATPPETAPAPTTLPATWWQDFSAQVTAAVVLASHGPRLATNPVPLTA
jgi:hypothetical protein